MITYILYFLFVLGVLVFVHELGHFLAARRVGIRVLTFSLGFGPKLLKYTRGDTEYCISALPLGGYVKMAGEAADEPRSGAPDEFMSKTKWQRFQVLIMGPVMNLLLAFFLTWAVLAQAAPILAYQNDEPEIAWLQPGSPAEKAGLRVGDRITAIDGTAVPTWEDVEFAVIPRPNATLNISYVRDGVAGNVELRSLPDPRNEKTGWIGALPDSPPVISRVEAGKPADTAGLKAGDQVIAVNDVRVVRTEELQRMILEGPGSVTLTVRREGAGEQRITVVRPEGEKLIGVTLAEQREMVNLTAGQAFVRSFRDNYKMGTLIFSVLGGLFTGENSIRQLQGPIAIAQASGDAATYGGWLGLFSFMAMLSLNLGLLNLLPIPVLDGGHILIMGLEGIARRDFSMQLKERMLMAGFVLLMVLMVTVFYNDLAGLVR